MSTGGPVAAGYVGILGVGALFLAVGTFASTLSRSQLVAALVTFVILVPLFTFGLLESLTNSPVLKELFGYLDIWRHMEEFSKGIVDSRRLVYYFSVSGLLLFLAARSLELKKWR